MRRLVAGVLVVALLVGGGPGLVLGGSGAASATESSATAPPDPDSDVVGWEAGYWYNESIDVDQSDGLTDAELEVYVARAMARVEHLREKEFRSEVPVSVQSREAYRNRSPAGGNRTNASYDAWNDQVWESLFVVGEDTDANAALSDLRGSSVQGYYSPSRNEIVVISEDGEQTIDNATLIHELTHALQDQHYNLSRPKYAGQTQDGSLAANGIVEGVAGYVETRYAQRCAGEWDCVAPPAGGGGGGQLSNYGLYLVLFHPYSDGPAYVNALRERGGWEAVNQSMRHPPNSTEQIIHVTNETPASISVEDTATAGWQPFPSQGVNGTDTLGEASIYAMFWYQTRNYDAEVVDLRDFTTVESRFDAYDYSAGPSAGWAGDRVLPYRQTVGNETRYGYVWATEWDTRADAREFADAYRAVLRAQGATRVGADTYRVPDGPFADAFHVSRNGTRVTVVNGPEVADLSEIRPGIEVEETTTAETTTTTATEPGDTNATTTATDTTTSDGIPGFGVGIAVAALLLLAGLAAIRRLNGGDQ